MAGYSQSLLGLAQSTPAASGKSSSGGGKPAGGGNPLAQRGTSLGENYTFTSKAGTVLRNMIKNVQGQKGDEGLQSFIDAGYVERVNSEPEAEPEDTSNNAATPAPPVITPPSNNRPATPAPVAPAVNPNLPRDPVQPNRGQTRFGANGGRDVGSDNAMAQGGYRSLNNMVAADQMGRNQGNGRGTGNFRGGILSAVYRLPDNGTRAVRSLQAFNGPRGNRTVLGS